MKKALVVILCVVLALALIGGGVVAYAWHQAGQAVVPDVSMVLAGRAVVPYAWQLRVPVLGGLLERSLSRNLATQAVELGEIAAADLASPVFSQGEATLEVTLEGASVYEGPAEGWPGDGTPAAGLYVLRAMCSLPESSAGTGSFYFWVTFAVPEPEPEPADSAADTLAGEWPVPSEPTFDYGRTTLQQGDIFPIQLRGIPEGVTPAASTDLGSALFTPVGGGRWTAMVPVGNTRAPGSYPVYVTAGEASFNVTVTVEAYDYDVQDLTIDVTDPVISEANSSAAIQEYNNVILALRQQADPEQHWAGMFIRPTEGEISTHFGLTRYTNGDYANPSIHWGMDIKNAEGTPIYATNAGRVAYADYLLAVGYTVIIEHGGGLKSYHFHMSKLHVTEGEMVEQGQLIGEMGTTGYSTGNHLHFEMRIGSQAISPEFLLTEEAGLYSLKPEDS